MSYPFHEDCRRFCFCSSEHQTRELVDGNNMQTPCYLDNCVFLQCIKKLVYNWNYFLISLIKFSEYYISTGIGQLLQPLGRENM
jgi:hypothetical protein